MNTKMPTDREQKTDQLVVCILNAFYFFAFRAYLHL